MMALRRTLARAIGSLGAVGGAGAWARSLGDQRAWARCEVCGRWPAKAVCTDCLRDLGDTGQGIGMRCLFCAMPLSHSTSCIACPACRLRPPPLDACATALPYAYPWNDLIARLKFGNEPGLAAPLARLMANTRTIAQSLAEAEAVIPLPLSPARLSERGYNQALELARRLAPRGQLVTAVLRRVRDTAAQSTLGRQDREHNLRHAFAVDPARAATIRGRRLLLVDDVMTSGATLHAAARILRQAGAARVSAVVLARTDLP